MDYLSEALTASSTSRSGWGQGRLLLALTLVIIIVIVLVCADPTIVVALVAALLGFCAAYYALGDRSHKDRGAQEAFNPLPGAPAPYAVAATPRQAATEHAYPGAIDIDEYDTEAPHGHRDLTEGDNDFMPQGNPYNIGRVSAQLAADSCIDDEANDDQIDGDERITYQVRARNDETRVAAGTMNRRRDMDKYFREEVAEAEDREWWGRHEE
jgi:hypothetical protein